MNLQDCLPPEISGPATTITRIAAGLSGAGVYRVEAGGRALVLKVAADGESPADWSRALHIQRLAADADLAPRIVHVDESRRAVLTEFIADRAFISVFRDPRTHEGALSLLGRTVRRIHALAIPDGVRVRDPREFLTQVFGSFLAEFALPDFARDAVRRVLTETPPPRERPLVLSHNDLNPTNLVFDGEAIRMVDWAVAGPMDAFYDLATLSVFFRMDEATCLGLLAAYEGAPPASLPARFVYIRRLVAALAGTMSLYLARQLKHAGATGAETPETTVSLVEFYQQLRGGTIKLGTADGQWAFGLALLKESLAV